MTDPLTLILFFLLWVAAAAIGFHVGVFFAIRNIYVQIVEIEDVEAGDDD